MHVCLFQYCSATDECAFADATIRQQYSALSVGVNIGGIILISHKVSKVAIALFII